MIDEIDMQQLILMKNRILGFKENEINLDSLLSITRSLEEILNSLKHVDNQLKEDLTTEWWELELVSSVMMDRQVETISAESRQTVFVALENIENTINTAFANNQKK